MCQGHVHACARVVVYAPEVQHVTGKFSPSKHFTKRLDMLEPKQFLLLSGTIAAVLSALVLGLGEWEGVTAVGIVVSLILGKV